MTILDFLRSLSTVLAFAAFIAICLWAYSHKRRDAFEQAAQLPFADEPTHLSHKKTSDKNTSDKSTLSPEEKRS